jgi:hypothetical protein
VLGEPAGELVEIARLTLAGTPAGCREVERALREGDDRAVGEVMGGPCILCGWACLIMAWSVAGVGSRGERALRACEE